MSLVEFLRVRKAALIVGMVLTVLVLANTAVRAVADPQPWFRFR